MVSKNIPLDAELVIQEIHKRQDLPWNNGRINNYNEFPLLNNLFKIINSGIAEEDFMYKGDLFRIHTAYESYIDVIDQSNERVLGKIYEDGSCFVLPFTSYSNDVVAFSKDPDFTRKVFYKVSSKRQAVIIHLNTLDLYGIDINALYHRFGYSNLRLEDEKEVLFPLIIERVPSIVAVIPRTAKSVCPCLNASID